MRSRWCLCIAVGAIAIVVIASSLDRLAAANLQETERSTISRNLGEFWPLGAQSRSWNVVPRANVGRAHSKVTMSVANETVGPDRFILWFSNRKGFRPGQRNGELYRICRLPQVTWLFFETYINSVPGRPWREHPVESDRILLARGGSVTDLIDNGVYQACGAHGQPYLLWSGAPWHYRIQVWGHLTRNKARKWYWDAAVSGPEPIVNDCLRPAATRPAVKVQEAWWSNFKSRSGAWRLGSGEIDPSTGLPTGGDVRYGRTVWHGAGQTPYFMIGRGSGPVVRPMQCTNQVSPSAP